MKAGKALEKFNASLVSRWSHVCIPVQEFSFSCPWLPCCRATKNRNKNLRQKTLKLFVSKIPKDRKTFDAFYKQVVQKIRLFFRYLWNF